MMFEVIEQKQQTKFLVRFGMGTPNEIWSELFLDQIMITRITPTILIALLVSNCVFVWIPAVDRILIIQFN